MSEFIRIVDAVADGLSQAGVIFRCDDKVDRRIGQDLFDRQCTIDPTEKDCIVKAVSWMSFQGTRLLFSYLEPLNQIDLMPSSITRQTKIPSARGVTAYDIFERKLIGRIDILFKVEVPADSVPPSSPGEPDLPAE